MRSTAGHTRSNIRGGGGLAVLAVAVLLAAGPAHAQDDYGGLPPGEGRELVYGICSGCHSIKLVQQQGMSRKRWDHLLDWMVEKQGMPELDPGTRATVLDYLAEHFDPQRRPRNGGVSPFGGVQPMMPGPE